MRAYTTFINRLVDGELPAASPGEFGALLHWLAGRRNEAAVSIEKAFNARGLPPELARHHTLRYLDRSLFFDRDDYYRLLGLTPDCDFSAIRARHKQLLQIFHPDRHTEDRDWFTERAEQLNRAYAYLREHHGKLPSRATSSTIAKPPRAAKKPFSTGPRLNLRVSFAARKNRLRRKLKTYLGNAASFERRFYVFLYSVPAILLLLVYLHDAQDPDNPRSATTSSLGASGDRPSGPGLHRDPAVESGISVVVLADPSNTRLPKEQGATNEHSFDETAFAKTGTPERISKSDVGNEHAGVRATRPKSLLASDLDELANSSTPAVRPSQAMSPNRELSGRIHQRTVRMLTSADAPRIASSDLQRTRSGSSTQSVPREEHQEPTRDQTNDDGWRFEANEQNALVALDKTRPTSPAAANTRGANINDLIAVEALLNQYEIAYNFSKIDWLSRLFHQNAVDQDTKGRTAIEENYLNIFDKTKRRRLVIGEAQVEQVGDHRFNVTADYLVDRTLLNGESFTENGRLEMYVVRVDDAVKIRKLEYVVQ